MLEHEKTLTVHGDNGLLVNVEEIGRTIATADVCVFGFAHIQETLLVDGRSNDTEVSLIQVVDSEGSAEARIEWLYRRRPSLGRTESLSFVVWPHSADFLVESGVWELICDRVGAGREPGARAECDLGLRHLQNLHMSAVQALLKGEHCHDLWPRREVPEGSI